jgi:hypothetical protein
MKRTIIIDYPVTGALEADVAWAEDMIEAARHADQAQLIAWRKSRATHDAAWAGRDEPLIATGTV